MDQPDLLLALDAVVGAFERLGIPEHIGGSVASSAMGRPRTTIDIDLVAKIQPEQVEELAQVLSSECYADPLSMLDAVMRGTSFNLVHYSTIIKIDVYISRDQPYDSEAWARVHQRRLVDDGREYAMASAEDCILRKLEWFRLGGEVSERQWTDVLGVLEVQRGRLDLEYMQKWSEELGVADLLLRAMSEV